MKGNVELSGTGKGPSGWWPGRIDREMARKLNAVVDSVDDPLVKSSIAVHARTSLPGSGVRDWQSRYIHAAAIIDIICAIISDMGILFLRHPSFSYRGAPAVAALTFPVIWLCALKLCQAFNVRFIGLGPNEAHAILSAGIGVSVSSIVIAYLANIDISRFYVLAVPAAATVLDLTGRYLLRKHLHRLRSTGRCLRRVVAVGHAPAIAELASNLRRDTYHGLSIVGACLAGQASAPDVMGIPVLGGLDSVSAAVDALNADTVAVLACPEMTGTRLRELSWELEKTGTNLYVVSALLDVAGPRTAIRPVAGLPLMEVGQAEFGGVKWVIKGAFDRVTAALAVFILLPVFAAVALAIRVEDGGPVFFRQSRVGKDGHLFRVWKFRTMVVDAEEHLSQLAALNEAGGVLFKMRRDPRVTRTGAWLRRWTLDDLPQLFNVILGDMSLVGPRPAIPREAARYEHDMRRRLKVKPGITGLWQISGRSDLPWEEAVRLDIRYVENWSLALDLQILWKTCAAVIRGTGAY